MTILDFVTLDGGLATQVEEYLGQDATANRLWGAAAIARHPETLLAIHERYLEAGADIISSATYQATVKGFEEELGVSSTKAIEIICLGVRLACQAVHSCRERNASVAISLGPFGAPLGNGLEYTGQYGGDIEGKLQQALVAFHMDRLAALCQHPLHFEVSADQGRVVVRPSYLLFETIPNAIELTSIAQALQRNAELYPGGPLNGLPVLLSLSTQTDGIHLADGTPLAGLPIRHAFDSCGISLAAVGVNCLHPSIVQTALANLRCSVGPTVPLLAAPNSGERWSQAARAWAWDDEEAAQFSREESWAQTLAKASAKFVGGCCRTTPKHISALSRLRAERAAPPQDK